MGGEQNLEPRSQIRGAIRRVGLCIRPNSPEVDAVARQLAEWLEARGVELSLDPEAARLLGGEEKSRAELARETDLLVVLGGDGTLLAVAQSIGERPIPVVGINLGRLGFLAEIAPPEQFEALEGMLRGEFHVAPRLRLEVRVERGGDEVARFLALNDAVVARSDPSRMIDIALRADGGLVTTYHADGLCVATPTGSTAYSLSAGGPILLPGTHAFVVTPISAHTLSQRPVVVPRTTLLEMQVVPREGDAQLTVDGQSNVALDPEDTVFITGSAFPVHFATSPNRSRFDLLRTKLRWGAE